MFDVIAHFHLHAFQLAGNLRANVDAAQCAQRADGGDGVFDVTTGDSLRKIAALLAVSLIRAVEVPARADDDGGG